MPIIRDMCYEPSSISNFITAESLKNSPIICRIMSRHIFMFFHDWWNFVFMRKAAWCRNDILFFNQIKLNFIAIYFFPVMILTFVSQFIVHFFGFFYFWRLIFKCNFYSYVTPGRQCGLASVIYFSWLIPNIFSYNTKG